MEFRSESPISMDVPSSIQALAQHKHVRCIVKLGGAAITCKNELERINEESLVVVCSQLREAMNPETVESQGKVLGMDWSRRLGASIESFADDFDVDSTLVSDSGFIIVHGAGSFGHFQASRTGVNKGGLHLPLVKAGFVATRISCMVDPELDHGFVYDIQGWAIINQSPFFDIDFVDDQSVEDIDQILFILTTAIDEQQATGQWYLLQHPPTPPTPVDFPLGITVTSLNLEIVRALAREGITAVGISPFACGWSTQGRNVRSSREHASEIHILRCLQIACAEVSQITKALSAGFVPVLHGDAVIDHSQVGLNEQGCTILSGDVIIRHLAQLLLPEYVVFLTDVLGVYDRPPTNPNARLLREITVDEDGNWSIITPTPGDVEKQAAVEITVASHDTTGGMETKILEAAAIAKLGINVYITKVGTEHSLTALKGEITDDWLGTVIRSSKKLSPYT
ncbi:hypothetical protein IEQ34_009823 [Dendrobium chrysotoxum]|uniref:Isopentenyl phosphate kinase n=1 Tax=Dendrobium chrysotoxum TaxID=161865 RepID=A0AAV7H400_DENCH|nr:hypothetical protein IEQ34_009823 [Dendrobium chrysotoxum]